MKEVEILVDFDNTLEEALNILSKFSFEDEKEIIDIYYENPLSDNFKPEEDLRINEILRLRRKGDKALVTYKKNYFEGKKWVYSDEDETEVKDYDTMKNIIEKVGFVEQIKVHNVRRTYKYNDYEIVLDELKDVGIFLEVEKMINDDSDIISIKSEIMKFIMSLGFKNIKELNIGKNQIMLRKKLGFKDIIKYVDNN